jgi:hypothetical protein
MEKRSCPARAHGTGTDSALTGTQRSNISAFAGFKRPLRTLDVGHIQKLKLEEVEAPGMKSNNNILPPSESNEHSSWLFSGRGGASDSEIRILDSKKIGKA